MPLRPRSLLLILAASLVAGACSDSTSPPNGELDGSWGSRPVGTGFAVGFDLRWLADIVAGSGTYIVFATTSPCSGAAGLTGNGSVTLSARRGGSNTIHGSLTFDTGWQPTFTGTIDGTGGTGTAIDGSLVNPDGTTCPLVLFEGSVP